MITFDQAWEIACSVRETPMDTCFETTNAFIFSGEEDRTR